MFLQWYVSSLLLSLFSLGRNVGESLRDSLILWDDNWGQACVIKMLFNEVACDSQLVLSCTATSLPKT